MFDDLCEEDGRPGIPPEQLLMARVITAPYSARSLSAGQAGERLFCEQPGCNPLRLWFPGREPGDGGFNHSGFAGSGASGRRAARPATAGLRAWRRAGRIAA